MYKPGERCAKSAQKNPRAGPWTGAERPIHRTSWNDGYPKFARPRRVKDVPSGRCGVPSAPGRVSTGKGRGSTQPGPSFPSTSRPVPQPCQLTTGGPAFASALPSRRIIAPKGITPPCGMHLRTGALSGGCRIGDDVQEDVRKKGGHGHRRHREGHKGVPRGDAEEDETGR